MVCGLAVILSRSTCWPWACAARRWSPCRCSSTLSVPVSILSDALALPVFVGTALLFLRLVATSTSTGSGRGAAGRRAACPAHWASSGRSRSARWSPPCSWRRSSRSTDLLDRDIGGSATATRVGRFQLTTVNPFIRLRRDLVEKTHTPLVYAKTEATLDVVPAHDGARRVHRRRVAALAARPARREHRRRRVPQPAGAGPGHRRRRRTTGAPARAQLRHHLAAAALPDPRAGRRRAAGATTPAPSTSRTSPAASPPGAELQRDRVHAGHHRRAAARRSRSAGRRSRKSMTELPEDLPAVITGARQGGDRGRRHRLRQGRRAAGLVPQRRRLPLLAGAARAARGWTCSPTSSPMTGSGTASSSPPPWPPWVVRSASRHAWSSGSWTAAAQPDGRILYTSDERHAWPEMYFSGVGWVRFEPTPASAPARPRRGPGSGATRRPTRPPARATAPSQAPGCRTPTRTRGRRSMPTTAGVCRCRGGRCWSGPVVVLVLVVVPARGAPGPAPAPALGAPTRSTSPRARGRSCGATALDLGLDWPEQRSPREQATRVVRPGQAGARGRRVAGGAAGPRWSAAATPPRAVDTVGTVEPEARAAPCRPWSPGARRCSAASTASAAGAAGCGRCRCCAASPRWSAAGR